VLSAERSSTSTVSSKTLARRGCAKARSTTRRRFEQARTEFFGRESQCGAGARARRSRPIGGKGKSTANSGGVWSGPVLPEKVSWWRFASAGGEARRRALRVASRIGAALADRLGRGCTVKTPKEGRGTPAQDAGRRITRSLREPAARATARRQDREAQRPRVADAWGFATRRH